jgi:hypothetical protein
MGLPIPDAPPLAAQQASAVSAGFEPGPPLASICGFTIPSFLFKISFNLPGLAFPPPLPTFRLSLGLNCDLNNPFDVSAGLAYGGGRVATQDPNPDDDLARAQ